MSVESETFSRNAVNVLCGAGCVLHISTTVEAGHEPTTGVWRHCRGHRSWCRAVDRVCAEQLLRRLSGRVRRCSGAPVARRDDRDPARPRARRSPSSPAERPLQRSWFCAWRTRSRSRIGQQCANAPSRITLYLKLAEETPLYLQPSPALRTEPPAFTVTALRRVSTFSRADHKGLFFERLAARSSR